MQSCGRKSTTFVATRPSSRWGRPFWMGLTFWRGLPMAIAVVLGWSMIPDPVAFIVSGQAMVVPDTLWHTAWPPHPGGGYQFGGRALPFWRGLLMIVAAVLGWSVALDLVAFCVGAGHGGPQYTAMHCMTPHFEGTLVLGTASLG